MRLLRRLRLAGLGRWRGAGPWAGPIMKLPGGQEDPGGSGPRRRASPGRTPREWPPCFSARGRRSRRAAGRAGFYGAGPRAFASPGRGQAAAHEAAISAPGHPAMIVYCASEPAEQGPESRYRAGRTSAHTTRPICESDASPRSTHASAGAHQHRSSPLQPALALAGQAIEGATVAEFSVHSL